MKTRIWLVCSYCGAPGADWYTQIEFRTVGARTEVWEKFGLEEPLRRKRSWKGPLNWRRCAEFLLDRDSMYAIPDVAIAGAETSEKGWRGEALTFCWARYGDDKEQNYGCELLSLSDAQIRRLRDEFGTLTSGRLIERFDSFAGYTEILHLEKKRLSELLRMYRVPARGPMLGPLIQKLEAQAEALEG